MRGLGLYQQAVPHSFSTPEWEAVCTEPFPDLTTDGNGPRREPRVLAHSTAHKHRSRCTLLAFSGFLLSPAREEESGPNGQLPCSPRSGLRKGGYSGPSGGHRRELCAGTCRCKGQKSAWQGRPQALRPRMFLCLCAVGPSGEVASATLKAPRPGTYVRAHTWQDTKLSKEPKKLSLEDNGPTYIK